MNAPLSRHGSIVGQSHRHDSAHLHVTGQAHYTADIPLPAGALHAAIAYSPHAHATFSRIDRAAMQAEPGVIGVLTAQDIPGHNNYGGIRPDDPLLAETRVEYAGQPVCLVVAASHTTARQAARKLSANWQPLPAILDIDAALAANHFLLPSETLVRGEPDAAMAAAPRQFSGQFAMGGQEHFYLESQVAVATPGEDNGVLVHSSTQHPSEVQHIVAEALGLRASQVTVQCRRMGGAFGGKESQAALVATLAALGARHFERTVCLRLDRDDDMLITGKRHDFQVRYRAGTDEAGHVLALDVKLASRCGYSADLSGPVNDRAMLHIDNAYWLPAVRVTSHRLKTHTASNTAFRGFGGPQGMLAIEAILDDIARQTGVDPWSLRRKNLYQPHQTTPYGMSVESAPLATLVDSLAQEGRYAEKRAAVDAFNAASPTVKRGLALTPVKFGISFTATHYNQAGALLHIYTDGSVLIHHGGTEMGQGLFTKIAQIVAEELGIRLERVSVSATDTAKVPNTSATAASSGSDLNGQAAAAAAQCLRSRLAAFAAARFGIREEDVLFANDQVFAGPNVLGFDALVKAAYLARVQLSATGYYATPGLAYEKGSFQGRPFYYFACAAALAEVAIDTLTGEMRTLSLDVLHDAGRSLNPALDIGQVEGGLMQGLGWLTMEQLVWTADGKLATHAPSTYKIPTARNWPASSRIRLLAHAPNPADTIHRSKAVGEPPFMLGMAVFFAVRDAVAACAPAKAPVALNAPATAEAILHAVQAARAQR
ncbi:xanthine dehydrogenase molybdopterin binding subunit [Crenobacter intestini]|uniref:Xanthine dehydrogenase molybdopterin binding subunit n=1 Tax=Crenobacter intestini TaxID=2563443 RepID=A0A4T0V773_9NEIS|nr:xanthine dehydrogenase molybdopterin binding subunit [Crenobacter intestini]TIC87125.1 xanthine dehydrogenase molybdopterin binding subunit [Crenobacter intestini]